MSLSPEAQALRARQGAGARWDSDAAPAETLLLARRGTAYFARVLGALGDETLSGNAALTVARVGYHARGLAEALSALRTGSAAADWSLQTAAARGASLPPRALRSLVFHACIHLDVEWRDLAEAHWDASVTLFGELAPVRETPVLRARILWRAALDLGGRARDVPEGLAL